MAEPLRTCILTRQRLPRSALVRVVADGSGRLQLDPDGGMPGRGAWVRPELALLQQLQQRPSQAGRALRCKNLSSADLVGQARAWVWAGIRSSVAECRRAGLLVSGAVALQQAGTLPVAMLAAGTRAGAGAAVLAVELPISAEELGAMVGRGPRAVVGVRPGRPTRRLAQWLQRGVGLGYPTR